MADNTNNNSSWLSDSLGALPGTLDGVSKLILAEKGISNAPVTYVQGAPAVTSNNNMLLIGGAVLVVVVLLVVALKK